MTGPARIQTADGIGRIVRAARRDAGLTQLELAGYCNVGVTFISQLENGKQTAEVGKVLKVMQRLGLDIHATRR